MKIVFKQLYRIKNFITVILLVLILVWGVFLRFTDPELTETQLFIEYWPEWIIMVIATICLAIWCFS